MRYEVAGAVARRDGRVFVGVIALGYRVFSKRAPTIAEQL